MSKPTEEFDVVIVGAGPAGVTCANFMGLMGIKTLVVDREKDILNIPRAIAIDEEGSRILQSIGIWEQFSKSLIEIDSVKMVSPFSGELVNLDTTTPINGYRRCRTMKQPDLEKALHKGLERFPHVTLRRLTDMVSLEDKGDEVVLELQEEGTQDYQVKSKFVLACDGAKSPTRELLGYNLIGSTYEKDWVVLDTFNDLTPDARRHVEFICDPQRSAVSMPAPNGGRRWEFILQPDEKRDEMLTEAKLQSLLDNWKGKNWGKIEDLQVERKTVYTFSARVADGFQKGNVVLIGDAAHVTPPFVGQGLMAGLRDTSNICWKVAMAAKGTIDKKIVDTYEIERRKNAEEMINLAVKAGKVIMPESRIQAFFRDRIFGLFNAIPFVRERLWGEKSKMKPLNGFDKGFVIPSKSFAELKVGEWFPQGQMLQECGKKSLLDDIIGINWAILGIGVDPAHHLDTDLSRQWERWNGKLMRIDQDKTTSKSPSNQTVNLIDSESVFKKVDRKSLCIIVRPDRHVAGLVKAKDLEASLATYMNQL